MTVDELCRALRECEVTLYRDGEVLHYRAPKGALTDDLRHAICQHKTALMALVQKGGAGDPATLQTPQGPTRPAWASEGTPAPCPACGHPEWVPHAQYDKVCAYLASKEPHEKTPQAELAGPVRLPDRVIPPLEVIKQRWDAYDKPEEQQTEEEREALEYYYKPSLWFHSEEAQPVGGNVAGEAYTTRFFTCPQYVSRERAEDRLKRWLQEECGVTLSRQRLKAHGNDLRREAGDYGFHQGQRYETRVRQWIADHYGPDFFLPHRWLCATDKAGGKHFREVDGIERYSAEIAFVYEIKQHTSRYDTLMQVYLPLLHTAFPHVQFCPIEINKGPLSPYWPSDCPVEVLPSLDARQPCEIYQYVTLDV